MTKNPIVESHVTELQKKIFLIICVLTASMCIAAPYVDLGSTLVIKDFVVFPGFYLFISLALLNQSHPGSSGSALNFLARTVIVGTLIFYVYAGHRIVAQGESIVIASLGDYLHLLLAMVMFFCVAYTSKFALVKNT